MAGMSGSPCASTSGPLIVQKEVSGARVGQWCHRGADTWKNPAALNSQIQRVVGLVHIALGHDDLAGRGLRAEADLQSGGDRLLALRRSRRDQVLVDHVLKLQLPLAKADRRGVGEIVGDGVQIQLLRAHAAGGRIESSNHGVLLLLSPEVATRLTLNLRQVLAGRFVEVVVEDG